MVKSLRIVGGYRIVMELYSPYRVRIYEYNDKIKDSGYYLKPLHIVHKVVGGRKLKYLYFGRYWYRVIRRRGKIRWVYVGRDKPDPHLPDPPISPFEGLGILVEGEDVLVDEKTYEALSRISVKIKGENLLPEIKV